MAKNMKNHGSTPEYISKITGLSLEDIEKLWDIKNRRRELYENKTYISK